MRGSVLHAIEQPSAERTDRPEVPPRAAPRGAGARRPANDSPDESEVEAGLARKGQPGSEMVGRLISHYRILDVIDAGGMGAVYKAEDTRLHTPVALKLLPRPLNSDPERRERFLREAQALARISHTNVCQFHEFSQTRDGQPFLVMEYCEGETLAARLRRGQMTIAEVIGIGIQVAAGLGAIHDHHLVHRDINPRNLVMHPDGTVKIIDFGIARLLDDVSITTLDVRIGTPSYMSPEQMMGESGLDHRSDIWSLGVTLYEMLARTLPFPAEQYDALAYEITSEDPRPLEQFRPDVPADLDNLIQRLLAKKVSSRPQSAAEVHDELATISTCGGGRTEVLPPSRTERRIKRAWRLLRGPGWLYAGVLGMLLAAVAYRPALSWLAANRCFWFANFGAPGCALPEMKHIALVNFATSGDTESAADFAAGLAEEIKNQLEELNRSDAAICMGRPHHHENYGDNLWLQADVRRTGETVHVSASLRRPGDAVMLRRLSAIVPVADIYRIQQGLSHELAGMAGLNLENAQPAEVTNDVRSMELFLEGLAYLRQARELDGDTAVAARTEARMRLEESLKIDRFHGPAFAALGDVQRLDQSEESRKLAIANYRRAIEQTALKGGAYLVSTRAKLAETYLEAKEFRAAIEQFSEALRYDPSNAVVYRGLGRAYAGLGRDAEAEKAFQSAVARQSVCWYNRWTLARFYGRRGCDAKAVEQMEAIVAADPGNLYVQSSLASYYLRLERYAQAEETLKYVIARQPRVVALSNLGWAYYLSQRFDESLRQMELAASMEPENPALNGNVGELALLIPGRTDQARTAFRRAVDLGARQLETAPDDAFGWVVNGYWRARLEDFEGSLNAISRAVAIAPANKEVLFRAAASYEIMGRREEALAALERALELGFSVNEVHRSEPLYALLETDRYREIERRIVSLRQAPGGMNACEFLARKRTAQLN